MNVKISVFDVIAYILPGTVILLSMIILMGGNIYTVQNLIDRSSELNIYLSVLLAAVSYILGFAIYDISGSIFGFFDRILPNKFLPPVMDADEKSKKWVLLREYSEANYNLINRYDALKGMGQNLIGTLLILCIVCFIKFFTTNMADSGWWHISLLTILLIMLLFTQTRKYNYYTALDLNKTIDVLGLEERSKQ